MEHRLGGHTKVQRKYPETQHRGFLHCHWHGKLRTHPLAASSSSEIISTTVRCNSEFRGSSDAVTGEVTAWQPNCMRCDQMAFGGSESPCRGCKAIVPETSSCGSVSVSSDVSDVVPRGRVSAHGVTEPMKSCGVTQPKVGGTKLVEIRCSNYRLPDMDRLWWSCIDDERVFFIISAADLGRSECAFWVQTDTDNGLTWTNEKHGYFFYEQSSTREFMSDDDASVYDDHNENASRSLGGATEPTADQVTQ